MRRRSDATTLTVTPSGQRTVSRLTPASASIWEAPNTLAIIHVDGVQRLRRRGMVPPHRVTCIRHHTIKLSDLVWDGGLACTHEYPRTATQRRRRCDAMLWSIMLGRGAGYFIADVTYCEIKAIADLGLSLEDMFELFDVHIPLPAA